MKPKPAAVSLELLRGELVAHRFSTRDWPPGWGVGTVDSVSTAKRTAGQYLVDYGKEFTPSVYIHKLLLEDYGVDGNWLHVGKQ